MTELVLHPSNPVYISAAPDDLGGGWRKLLAFVPHRPSGAQTVLLQDVLGTGCIVVAGIQGSAEWVSADWVAELANGMDAQLAFLRRPQDGGVELHGEMRCKASGRDWVLKAPALVECSFSGHFLTLLEGTRLSYAGNAAAPLLEFAAPRNAAATLGGFELHGHVSPDLLNLKLHLAWPAGMMFSAELEVPVLEYEGTSGASGSTVLGQNFARLRTSLFGRVAAECVSYPLVAAAEDTTVLHFDIALDPVEPQILHPVPTPTRKSLLCLTQVKANGIQLDPIPLNFFTAAGERLNAAAVDFAGLEFHFVPRLASLQKDKFDYSGAVLMPHGELKASSGSALLGAGLLERVEAFTAISFDAFAPAAGLDAQIRDAEDKPLEPVEPGLAKGAYLCDRAVVSSITFRHDGRTPRVLYSPDAMPLYKLGGPLEAHPYKPFDCPVPGAMPIGMVDLTRAAKDSRAFAFERSVISPHRIGLLGDVLRSELDQRARRPGARALALADVPATTPQGFRVIEDENGVWKSIEFAAGADWRLVFDFGLDPKLRHEIQAVFSTKEIFIVITDMPKAAPGAKPSLRIEYAAGGWRFGVEVTATATAVSAPAPTVEAPLCVIKFGSRAIKDLIADTDAWNGTTLFVGDGDLAKIRTARDRLAGYVAALEQDLANDQNSRKPFAAPFVAPGAGGSGRGKLVDPAWNGFCVFSLGMSGDTASLPADLVPLLQSYVKSLAATVLCADIRPAASSDVSDVVALVRHEADPKEEPDDSPDPDCSGGLSLQFLRVLLKSGGVDNFECKLKLRLSKFLGQPTGLYSKAILVGTYDKRTDTTPPSENYSFSLVGSYEVKFGTSSPVERVKLTKIGYERISGQDGQILLQGEIDLGFDDLGAKGISFDKMGLAFSSSARKFNFNPGLISLDFDSNGFSKLLRSFPLKLKSFTFGRLGPMKFAKLTDLGFEPLGGEVDFAYGLTFDMDLGSLGAIARKIEAFGAQLFVGWKFSGGARIPSLGLRLSGNRGGPLEINAFDVITLTADSYGYGKVPGMPSGEEVYYLNAQNLRMKLLGMEFPPEAQQKQHLYFFYPLKNPGGVGFLYGLKDKGAKVSLLGIGKHATVAKLSDAKTVEEGMGYIDAKLDNVNQDKLPMTPGAGVIYDSKVDWFLALVANVFGLADVKLLMADPKIYGARITIPKSKWGLGNGDWFIDMLYRRLDDRTGIFSVEVPPPIPMLDFGAVQVILPTIRAEFGSPGNHMLVDLGFPEKKSLASWARTGKIVAGIFGGEGGAYFGRIAPGAFPVPFTPTYAAHYEFKDGSIFTAGIAASFGLMRYFGSGPMTGHASLTGFFTAEGSIATIQLKEGQNALVPSPPRTFIDLAGAFGIKGNVEACVDFGLIKVAVGFNITVMFSLLYKTWHAIVMETSLTVNAYARVVIARISIPFDGKIEIAISFSFSFRTAVQVQLAGADSRLATVFDTSASRPQDPLVDHRVLALTLVPPKWDWPAATPASLGLKSSLPFPAWFMATRSIDEDQTPNGTAYAAALMPFLAIGQNPQYDDEGDSVGSLVDVLTRWMLMQISGTAAFDPTARIPLSALLAANAAFQPGGKDGSPEVKVIPLSGSDGKDPYRQSISDERGLRTPRTALTAFTIGKLQGLYRQCLVAQALVPASDPVKSRSGAVAAVMYPLPPAFELFTTANAPKPEHDWDFSTTSSIDLSTNQALKDSEVDQLRTALESYYATLLVGEDKVVKSATAETSQSMQSWLFLFWHQLLCAELARGIANQCEEVAKKGAHVESFTAGELLDMVHAGGTGSLGWKAAGTAARLFNAGLRFDLSVIQGRKDAHKGSMAVLAGIAMPEPAHDPGDEIFIGLRSLKSAPDWFAIAPGKYTKEGTHEGVKKRAIALEVTPLYGRTGFPGSLLAAIDTADKGYTRQPRRYAVTRHLSLGAGQQIGFFPPMLLARQRSIGGDAMEWRFYDSELSGSPIDLNKEAQPGSNVIALQLRGKVVSAGAVTVISLEPLAAAERETLRSMENLTISATKLGMRPLVDAKTNPQNIEDVTSALSSLEIFRSSVTREENPPKIMLLEDSASEPYLGQGAEGLLKVIRAWMLTSASSCFISAPFKGLSLTAGDAVELLAVFDPVKISPNLSVVAANAVLYSAAKPSGLLIGGRVNDMENVPDSHPSAIVVKAVRRPALQAMIETPAAARSVLGAPVRITLAELKGLAAAGGDAPGSMATLAQDDLALLADLSDSWASQFDLLAYSVYVDDKKWIDENDVIPFMPNCKDEHLHLSEENRPAEYIGHIPTSRLTDSGNPYALVGKKIRVEGYLRDHFGQRAPLGAVKLLERVEEYRDQIVSPDEWEHMRIGLSVANGAPLLLIMADLKACRADNARAVFLTRRFKLLKMQLEDTNLSVKATWSFGMGESVDVLKDRLLALLDELAEALRPGEAGKDTVEIKVPLAWPTLPAAWSALPVGAVLRVTRSIGTNVVQEATLRLAPLEDSGSGVPKAFFSQMLGHYGNALLGAGDAGPGFGRYWLVRRTAVELKLRTASASFSAMPPYSNRLVSADTLADRDVDLALRESFDKLDVLLQDNRLPFLGTNVAPLLKLKKTASVVCASRTTSVGVGQGTTPEATRRALEDAVAAKAGDAYRIASVLDLEIESPSDGAADAVMKIVGDLAPPPGSGSQHESGVTTIGIVRTGEDLHLPLVVWDRQSQVGTISVKPMQFRPIQVQIDVKDVPIDISVADAEFLQDRLPYRPVQGHWLKLVDIDTYVPNPIELAAFTAPSPLREAVQTPLAQMHFSSPSEPVATSLAQAKNWDYEATFKLPPGAKEFDSRVDALRCEIDYLFQPSERLTLEQPLAGSLLEAAVEFNKVSAPDGNRAKLAENAAGLERELAKYGRTRMLGGRRQVDGIKLKPNDNGTYWNIERDAGNVCQNVVGSVDNETRKVFTVKVPGLDLGACSFALASLQVSRNEELVFGYGLQQKQALDELFIYRTPRVSFSDAVMADLAWDTSLSAGKASRDAADWVYSVYEELLRELMKLGDDERNNLSVQCRVGWNVDDISRLGGDGVEPAPVAMLALKPSEISTLKPLVLKQVEWWMSELKLMALPADGHWSLDVAVFARSSEGVGEEIVRRLANFKRLMPPRSPNRAEWDQ